MSVKLLSQGGYGCVYYPGLFCDGTPLNDDKIVTKLQVDAEWTDREIKLGSEISKVNNFHLYFAPVIESCNFNLKNIKDPSLLDECEVIKEGVSNYKIMFIPYVEKQGFLYTLFKDYNSRILLYLFEINKQLLTSIKKLVDSSIIHFDLKAENIILNKKNSYPIIIDFGISIGKDDLNQSNYKNYFYAYHPEYTPWSLEIHLINYFVKYHKPNTTVENEHIVKVCTEFIYFNKRFANVLSKKFTFLYREKSIEYYKKYVGKKVGGVVADLINISWNTWDSYSISIMNLQILHLIFNNKFFENELLKKYYEYLLLNVHYDPTRRPTIQEQISSIQSFYSRNSLEENQELYDLIEKYLSEIKLSNII